MAPPRKLTEDMLLQAVLSLPAGKRTQKDIMRALSTLYNISPNRGTVSQRLQEWGIMHQVQTRAREVRREAVNASVAAVETAKIADQATMLNQTQGVLSSLLTKAADALQDLAPADLAELIKIVDLAGRVMLADSKVRMDMAEIKAAAPAALPSRSAAPSSGAIADFSALRTALQAARAEKAA